MLLECLICCQPRWGAFDFCDECGTKMRAQIRLESAVIEQRGLKILTLARYEGPLKNYVAHLKRRPTHWRISTQASLRLLIQDSPLPLQDEMAKGICPVPSSRMRELSSFSLSLCLAHELSTHLKIPLLHPLPKRNTLLDFFLETDQKYKKSAQRTEKPAAWIWQQKLAPEAPQKILLVDDVITSGTSLTQLQQDLSMRSYRVSTAFCLLRSKHFDQPTSYSRIAQNR